jgi:hypothetical protein
LKELPERVAKEVHADIQLGTNRVMACKVGLKGMNIDFHAWDRIKYWL